MNGLSWRAYNLLAAGGARGEEIDDEHGTGDENAKAKAQIVGRETKRTKESAAEVTCESVFPEQQISEEMAWLRVAERERIPR